MNALILILSILASSLGCDVIRKSYCRNMALSVADMNMFIGSTVLGSLFILIPLSLFAGTFRMPSLCTVLMALLFGLVTGIYCILNMRAMGSGPLSYTSVIISCSMALPALSGMVLYGEQVTACQWIGAGLMLLSVILAVDRRNDSNMAASFRWLALSVGACIVSGMLGVIQKIHQHTEFSGERDVFLIIAYTVSAVFLLALAFSEQKKNGAVSIAVHPARFLLYAVFGSIGVAVANKANLYLSGVMPAILLFPIYNGCRMALTMTVGFAVWKEKLSPGQLVGLFCSAAAIFLLCGAF